MHGLETYSRVRRTMLRDGMSMREAARAFGRDRGAISKMVKVSAPPGYRRAAPRKQRHTVQRISERLRAERGFTGGYTTVRDYVQRRRQALKEAFAPLARPLPGDQAP